MFQSQLDAEFPQLVAHLAEVSHLTTVFSSSVNFYIYLVKSHHLLQANTVRQTRPGHMSPSTCTGVETRL